MSIICEGVDGVGKTTYLRQWLLFNPQYAYIHNFAKPKAKLDIESEILKEITLLSTSNKFALDRSYIISEFVYSTVLKRDTPVTFTLLQAFIDFLNINHHSIALFLYRSKVYLNYKEEDAKLPFDALNDCYADLLTNRLFVKYLVTKIIDEERSI